MMAKIKKQSGDDEVFDGRDGRIPAGHLHARGEHSHSNPSHVGTTLFKAKPWRPII
jgi:hypothetical protein